MTGASQLDATPSVLNVDGPLTGAKGFAHPA